MPLGEGGERVSLQYWTDANGDDWACAAYDHGPFCRLCTKVEDDVTRTMLGLVRTGESEVRTTREGDLQFRLTDSGLRKVKFLMDVAEAEGDSHARRIYETALLEAKWEQSNG